LRQQAERTHARLMPDYFREAPADAPGIWEPGQGPWSAVLVAEATVAPRAVLGFAAVKAVVTPRDPAMVPRRRAYLEVIVVDEAHRGTGIGTALMRAATRWARERDAEEMVLTVWSDNAAADALYDALGYQPIARILRRKI
jgi:ribosomal protein S18 acetylase RimI-like enzyme